ncbi:MAG: DNA double-strand break repair nuclease NurA [Thermofilaceae archaeon]|nr:DNA double-strand break repair nuclease NurA [Thermofilaceae archaeon]MCX8179804.1 DNA double-strand break repair nuclease NurA [Thermofilaceae archaeon]MDW8004331.1 DNA double-strand break repair nuclease NurA [Thermofilaceae archaeon]
MVYSRGLSVGFERADVEILAEKLKRMFEEERRSLQVSLDGNIVSKPIPVLNLFGRVIRGVPVDRTRLRVLEPTPHKKMVVAVDASAKMVFNLGSAAVLESKVVVLAYKGFKRFLERTTKRVALVAGKFEAAEWLARIEFEALLKASSMIEGKGYLLLDRSLTVAPLYRPTTRELIKKVEAKASASGLNLVGIPKRTKLALDTGEGALGYISNLARKSFTSSAWYYYPLFRIENLPPWMLGSPVVAKLSALNSSVLRLDVSKKTLARLDCGEVLSEISFLQDPSCPGYPYPLRAAHEMSKISESEVEIDRLLLTETLREWGVGDRLVADSSAYSNFKERSLWGDVV